MGSSPTLVEFFFPRFVFFLHIRIDLVERKLFHEETMSEFLIFISKNEKEKLLFLDLPIKTYLGPTLAAELAWVGLNDRRS